MRNVEVVEVGMFLASILFCAAGVLQEDPVAELSEEKIQAAEEIGFGDFLADPDAYKGKVVRFRVFWHKYDSGWVKVGSTEGGTTLLLGLHPVSIVSHEDFLAAIRLEMLTVTIRGNGNSKEDFLGTLVALQRRDMKNRKRIAPTLEEAVRHRKQMEERRTALHREATELLLKGAYEAVRSFQWSPDFVQFFTQEERETFQEASEVIRCLEQRNPEEAERRLQSPKAARLSEAVRNRFRERLDRLKGDQKEEGERRRKEEEKRREEALRKEEAAAAERKEIRERLIRTAVVDPEQAARDWEASEGKLAEREREELKGLIESLRTLRRDLADFAWESGEKSLDSLPKEIRDKLEPEVKEARRKVEAFRSEPRKKVQVSPGYEITFDFSDLTKWVYIESVEFKKKEDPTELAVETGHRWKGDPSSLFSVEFRYRIRNKELRSIEIEGDGLWLRYPLQYGQDRAAQICAKDWIENGVVLIGSSTVQDPEVKIRGWLLRGRTDLAENALRNSSGDLSEKERSTMVDEIKKAEADVKAFQAKPERTVRLGDGTDVTLDFADLSPRVYVHSVEFLRWEDPQAAAKSVNIPWDGGGAKVCSIRIRYGSESPVPIRGNGIWITWDLTSAGGTVKQILRLDQIRERRIQVTKR